MISKERLEELIKKCALIYGIEFNEIESYDLSDKDICISPINFGEHGLRVFNSLGYWNDIEFKNLFETKAEAEWHKEFGCIERTERLELPTWEEFKNNMDDFAFISKNKTTVYVLNHFFDNKIFLTDEWRDDETFEYTKDGYILACRKAKELFLGTEDEK